MAPAPIRQLSMLPPWTPGGIVLVRPAMSGATPAVPRCGRVGTRTPFSAGWRSHSGQRVIVPGTRYLPGKS